MNLKWLPLFCEYLTFAALAVVTSLFAHTHFERGDFGTLPWVHKASFVLACGALLFGVVLLVFETWLGEGDRDAE